MNDPALRAEFGRDPEGTVRRAGIELDDQDLAALKAADWGKLSDAALSQRVNKSSREVW